VVDHPVGVRPCGTFEEASVGFAALIGDESVSQYASSASEVFDAMLRPAFAKYPVEKLGAEWFVRVSEAGVVECVVFRRPNAFSQFASEILLGTKIARPPRLPMYMRFFSHTPVFAPGSSGTGDPKSNYWLKLPVRPVTGLACARPAPARPAA